MDAKSLRCVSLMDGWLVKSILVSGMTVLYGGIGCEAPSQRMGVKMRARVCRRMLGSSESVSDMLSDMLDGVLWM